MRLSYTKTLLIHLFLIISPTFLFNPTANAQQVLFANTFTSNSIHSRYAMNESENEPIGIEPTESSYGVTMVDKTEPILGFYCRSESLYLKPLIYHLNKSFGKPYPSSSVIHTQVCSIGLKHGIRFTFKLFKMVIVPLWQSK